MNKPIHSALEAIKAKYVEKIKTELPEQVAQFKSGSDDSRLIDLKNYLHKIAGSGGSFGFAEITHLGQAAESIAAELITHPSSNSEKKFDYLETLLNRLLDIVSTMEFDTSSNSHSTPEPITAQQITAAESDLSVDNKSGPLKVWVLDADESLASQLHEQLSSFGFDVDCFLCFDTFKKSLERSQPDFLIADVRLEGDLDFYQCMEKNRITLHATELIMMSAFDDFFARIKAVRAGALNYLHKPLNAARLASFIREHQMTAAIVPERILLIDDDTVLSELYQAQLESAGMQVHNLSDPTKVITVIQEYQPDLILIDLYMPDYSGMELASVIRQFDNFTSLPIVYVSSETNNERKNIALSKGADEFLTKPISKEILITTVKQRVKRARQIETMISKDSLTGLLKHSAIKDAVTQEVSRASRTNQTLCVCMLDIDRFKTVNDSYGHSIGDTVIASLATLLTQRVRLTDHVGRYGGEEFMLVMPACNAHDAHTILEDIRQRFSTIRFSAGEENFKCTVSAGYVEFAPGELLTSVDALVERADSALYHAKNTGRNRVVRSTEDNYVARA